MSPLSQFDDLKLKLEDIQLATGNFSSENEIGRGGFGVVYKGELPLYGKPTMVAFKHLDRKFGQGDTEFWKEITMLSKYKHKNLVSMLHFCIQGDNMILVYAYASRGSLNTYISKPSLTWMQRLKISVGVAKGLNYLHDPKEGQQRVLHLDIKSSNILLDDDWTPKVSDFGLSKVAPANQQHTFIFTGAVGTCGYCDPEYLETGFLSKESDLYSFGVVMFELICGKLCVEPYGEGYRIFVPHWRKSYENNTLDSIVFQQIKEEMDPGSLKTFSAIAYQCVKKDFKERPKMSEIIKELEFALEQQEVFDYLQKKVDFEEMSKIANLAHVAAEYKSQLIILFRNGILVDVEKTIVSLTKNGEFIELISATKCISGEELICEPHKSSRFSNALWGWPYRPFTIEVSTKYLSPHVTYTANLVYKHCGVDQNIPMTFQYKRNKDIRYSSSCITHPRGDGWLVTELFKFTSDGKQHTFMINFMETVDIHSSCTLIFFDAIEFRPVEL